MRNEKLTPASWPHVGRASQFLCRLGDSQTLRERLPRCRTELIHDTRSCMESSFQAQGRDIQYLFWIFMLGSTESWGVGHVFSRRLIYKVLRELSSEWSLQTLDVSAEMTVRWSPDCCCWERVSNSGNIWCFISLFCQQEPHFFIDTHRYISL